MSEVMEEEIKRWTTRRKSALILDIIQGKTTGAATRLQFDLPPAETESWAEDGKRDMKGASRTKPEDVCGQYEQQRKDLQKACGEVIVEICAQGKLASLWGEDESLCSRSSWA